MTKSYILCIIVFLFCMFLYSPGNAERLFDKNMNRGEAYEHSKIINIKYECGGDLRPDRALIVGGITAEGHKPLQVKKQLDTQITQLEKYADSQGGVLRLNERIRGVRVLKNLRPSQIKGLFPFIAIQKIVIEFPIEVDIDAAFEKILGFGIDRYGKSIRLDVRNSTPTIAVWYQFSNIQQELDSLYQNCRAKAWRSWCEKQTIEDQQKNCPEDSNMAKYLEAHSARFVTQPVSNEHGNNSPIYFQYPWQAEQLANIELVGDVTLHLKGSIIFNLVPPKN